MDKSRVLKARGPERKMRVSGYTCSMCQYYSSRYFNITRHEHRIHMVPKKPPQCCDTTFNSKADYYLHCEEVHPGTRVNLISQRKYGILAGNILSESIVDGNTSKLNNREYPQTRYLLRSRIRLQKDIEPAETTLDSIENSGIEDTSKKSTNKSSGYGTNNFTSMNLNSSSSELEDANDNSQKTDEKSSCELDYANDNYQEIDEKSSSKDSHSAQLESSSDNENREEDKSGMEIDEIPASVVEQRIDREHFNGEQSRADVSEGSASPSGNNLTMSSGFNDVEKQKSGKCAGNDELEISFESSIPMTSTSSNLPLKKRILQDLAMQNRENIEKSRKPMGDRLYREPIRLENEIKHISKKCRQSKKERRNLQKKMVNPAKLFSMSSDAENVPPVVSIVHSQEAWVYGVELRKSGSTACHEMTVRHREYLSLIDFNQLPDIFGK